jgi:thymidine phosphorylase
VEVQRDHIADGRAYEKFAEMVRAQGGDLDAPRPRAAEYVVTAERTGVVAAVDTEALGWTIIDLGGGRKVLSDKIDPSVGLEMLVRLGDAVRPGDPLVRVFAAAAHRDSAAAKLRAAITIGDGPVPAPALIEQRVDSE